MARTVIQCRLVALDKLGSGASGTAIPEVNNGRCAGYAEIPALEGLLVAPEQEPALTPPAETLLLDVSRAIYRTLRNWSCAGSLIIWRDRINGGAGEETVR
ncbi:hypothetical protein O5282_26910 [Escherichia coli]|nr:hypothetical protein [Escherichia coli]